MAAQWDFASDTLTRPTFGMVTAMVEACGYTMDGAARDAVMVGDDVKGEDPAINALQVRLAEMCGKEAGLFVASGTMSNQIGLRCHVTQLAAEKDVVFQRIICDARAHIAEHEFGGAAFNSGTPLKTIDVPDGEFLTADRVSQALFLGNDLHTACTTVVALENTIGGDVMPVEEVARVSELCREKGVRLHMDGARIWNACVAAGVDLRAYTQHCDTVSLCLSKGLGAPVGSVLVGPKRLIDMARQYRKIMGGGWRQGGLLAAAANYAIDNNWGATMAATHEDAKRLWRGLTELGFAAREPQTNTLWVKCNGLEVDGQKATWDLLVPKVNEPTEGGTVRIEGEGEEARFVVHFQTPTAAIDLVVARLKSALGK